MSLMKRGRNVCVAVTALIVIVGLFQQRDYGFNIPYRITHARFFSTSHSVKNVAPPWKVLLLFTYARGGSTVLGDLFNSSPNTTYWYEPVSTFYSARYGTRQWKNDIDLIFTDHKQYREMPDEERNGIQEYLQRIFGCEFSDLPTELFTRITWKSRAMDGCVKNKNKSDGCSNALEPHCGNTTYQILTGPCHEHLQSARPTSPSSPASVPAHIAKYIACMGAYRRKGDTCSRTVQTRCRSSRINVAKLTKIPLRALETFLRDNPFARVVYYVRDPRGILNSRLDTNKLSKLGRGDYVADAELLCRRMHVDYVTYLRLKERHPHAIRMLRYEDFAARPTEVARDIHAFIDVPLAAEAEQWLEKAMNSKKDGPAFGTFRKNSTATSQRWRHSLSTEQIRQMTAKCADLLQVLGYPQ